MNDALSVTWAALERGFIPGGGAALVRASDILVDRLGPAPGRGRRREQRSAAGSLSPDEYAGVTVVAGARPS